MKSILKDFIAIMVITLVMAVMIICLLMPQP
jgi:hypothetical protein